MKISLGTFARRSITAQTGRSVSAATAAAITRYIVGGGDLNLVPPPTWPDYADAGETMDYVELALDPDVEALLHSRAARLGVDVDRLATHGVMVYLAEGDIAAPVSERI